MAFGSIGSIFVEIGADISGLQNGLKQVGTEMDGLKGGLQQYSSSFKKAGLAMAGTAAAVGGISLKMAADFEGGMREVNTMMNLSEEAFQAMSDELLELSTEMAKSPEELTGALYQIISASIPAGEAIEFLGVAAKAAVAGVTDVETAADGLTTVINSFGMEASDAERVADIMFTTVKRGKTTFAELSAAMYNVAPLAAAAGVAFTDVSGALATMTKQGIPTKQATTQLRAALQQILKPTDDMAAALEALGYSSGEALLEANGLQGALNLLYDAAEGDINVMGTMFGSIEALQGVLALTGDNAQTLTDDIDAMAKASDGAGAATEAFNEVNKGAGRQFEEMKVQLQNVSIKLGTALMPAILAVVKALTPFLEKIGNFIAKHPKLSAAILAITLGLGSLLLVLGFLPAIISGVTIAMGALNAVFLANPIGLVIAAIAALIAICLLIWKYWEEIWDFMKRWGVYLLGVPGLIIKHWDTLKKFFTGLWDKVKSIFTGVVDWVKDKWDGLISFFKSIPEKIKSAFSTVKDKLTAPFKGAINAIISLLNAPLGWLSGRKIFSVTVPSWVPGLGGKGWSLTLPTLPQIPSLKYGGIVPGPIGSPQLVMAHGGEEYLGVGAKARGGDINITLSAGAFLGTRGEARRFAADIDSLIRENARLGGYE